MFVLRNSRDCIVCLIFNKDGVFVADLNELIPKPGKDIKDFFLRDIRAP